MTQKGLKAQLHIIKGWPETQTGIRNKTRHTQGFRRFICLCSGLSISSLQILIILPLQWSEIGELSSSTRYPASGPWPGDILLHFSWITGTIEAPSNSVGFNPAYITKYYNCLSYRLPLDSAWFAIGACWGDLAHPQSVAFAHNSPEPSNNPDISLPTSDRTDYECFWAVTGPVQLFLIWIDMERWILAHTRFFCNFAQLSRWIDQNMLS